MNILITGGSGYIGSRLSHTLLSRGHRVGVWDLDHLPAIGDHDFSHAGERSLREALRTGPWERVIHLIGSYSNDASISRRVNLEAALDAFSVCRENNIEKFVFVSTCGVLNIEDRSEYTKNKREAEKILQGSEGDGPCRLTILRLAPVYGLAPNMKYDSIVNGFIRDAVVTGRIEVWGKDEYRPVADILTVVEEIRLAVEGEAGDTTIKNIATGNFTKGQIAGVVKDCCPNVELVLKDNDKRGYRIEPVIPGRDLREGIEEVLHAEIL